MAIDRKKSTKTNRPWHLPVPLRACGHCRGPASTVQVAEDAGVFD
jgi:hypothetical protein